MEVPAIPTYPISSIGVITRPTGELCVKSPAGVYVNWISFVKWCAESPQVRYVPLGSELPGSESLPSADFPSRAGLATTTVLCGGCVGSAGFGLPYIYVYNAPRALLISTMLRRVRRRPVCGSQG